MGFVPFLVGLSGDLWENIPIKEIVYWGDFLEKERKMSIACFECGKNAEHNHHVVPRVLGGTRTVPLCTDCHGLVHDINLTRMTELQKIGIAKAKEKGKYTGRKPGARGKRPVDNDVSAKQAKELKAQGMDISEIARTLGMSRPTIYAWLKEENSNG